jgi:hypothetical protein
MWLCGFVVGLLPMEFNKTSLAQGWPLSATTNEGILLVRSFNLEYRSNPDSKNFSIPDVFRTRTVLAIFHKVGNTA